jgi:Protein of unknown function (DUF3040)
VQQDYDDGVVLTEAERETLAHLAASIEDPWLAHQLAGPDELTPVMMVARPARPQSAKSARWLRRWAGVMLIADGAGLAAAAFLHWMWMAVLGIVAMVVGVWMVWSQRSFLFHGLHRRPSRGRLPAAWPGLPRPW